MLIVFSLLRSALFLNVATEDPTGSVTLVSCILNVASVGFLLYDSLLSTIDLALCDLGTC